MNPPSDKSDPANREDPERESLIRRTRRFLDKEIWESPGKSGSNRARLWIPFLRIIIISGRGLGENRLFSRAAALSYSSLIALGPLVAIIAIFSSSFVQTDAETQIKRALLFIAPSLQEMVNIDPAAQDPEMASALDTLLSQIVDGAEGLLNQVNTGGSKAFGALGALILIWVVIQLLTSVETTLNQIWGVHQGRPWSQRIVFYWTFISLGALLGLGSTALFSASNLAGMSDWLPLGSDLAGLLLSFSPLLSFSMLVILLTLFYRFFPNTNVALKAAVIGSLITAALLILNNYLSILYVHRVISFQSLYGSVGIIPVLMIGLYFFWILILLGGQLTYSVQNVDFLATQSMWERISPKARELVTLGTFIQITRRFHQCKDAPTVNDIGQKLRVPVNILNESLGTLEDMDWITRIAMDERKDDSERIGFRPAKPLQAYTLSSFVEAFSNEGESEIVTGVLESDPLMEAYRDSLRWHESDTFFRKDLNTLLSEDKATTAEP